MTPTMMMVLTGWPKRRRSTQATPAPAYPPCLTRLSSTKRNCRLSCPTKGVASASSTMMAKNKTMSPTDKRALMLAPSLR